MQRRQSQVLHYSSTLQLRLQCTSAVFLLLARIAASMQDTGAGWVMGGSSMGSRGYKSTYSRSKEVQERCAPHLADLAKKPSPSRFPPNAEGKRWTILNELSFLNGDWQEEAGKTPLMPYVPVVDSAADESKKKEPVYLSSLWVTDVDVEEGRFSPQSTMVNVSVVLQLGVSSERALSYMGSSLHGFQIYPGFSLLSIVMEGVYAELKSGERLLCMVGSARLPLRGKNVSDPWDWLDSLSRKGLFFPPEVEDSQIMAVFHYPKLLTLTSRAVRGTVESFHSSTDPSFFNPVNVYGQLGAYSNYEFLSSDLVNSACSKPKLFPGELSPPSKIYQGTAFCIVAQELLTGQWVDVMPNWNCSVSNETCVKLGPFSDNSDSQLMDGGFNGTQLLVQDIRCVDYREDDGSYGANISAVFRAVLPAQNKNLAFERTGLDGLVLAAEGKWSSLTGELCMVGCRHGGASSSKDSSGGSCDTKIRIFIPLTLSLKRRSILQGSISSIRDDSDYFYPLSFHLHLTSMRLPRDVVGNITYEYTKINEAGTLLEKYEPIGVGERIKKSLLKYPSAGVNFRDLFEDLSLHSLAITNPDVTNGPHLKWFVELDIVTVEERVGLSWIELTTVAAPASAIDEEVERVEEQKNFYRTAAELIVKDELGNRVTAVSTEGEYDPLLGKMFLLGCRDVSSPWKTLQETAELLEDGLDCLMNLRVEYPPTNARWLINPTVMITLTSSRPEDDPLFFPPMNLETFPILYKRQREEIVSRKSLEGGLSILTLSLILGCIVSQLWYVRRHVDATPYISLLMLAVQAVGYSIPLITGVEALFARITSDAEDMKETVLNEGRWTRVIGYMVKLLTLAIFLLTLRIVQKVYKSRIRLGTRRPLEPWRVPSDKRVLAICSGTHILGFLIVLVIHSVRISQRPVNSSTYMDWRGSLHKQYDWERVLQEYYGLVQDLFLLPQVVGNHLWEVKGKPLRMLYYVGVTVLRLLPHVYDSLRAPAFNPYFVEEFQYANPSSDFYSKAGDIAIPVLAVLLAAIVYIQQRWNGLKWEKVLKQGSSKLMRMGSKMYERLPSKTFEAEMVETVTSQQMSGNGCTVVHYED